MGAILRLNNVRSMDEYRTEKCMFIYPYIQRERMTASGKLPSKLRHQSKFCKGYSHMALGLVRSLA